MFYELEIDLVNLRAVLRGRRDEDDIWLEKSDIGKVVSDGHDRSISVRDVFECVENALRERGEEVNQLIIQPHTESYFWIHTKPARGLDREKIARGVGDIKKILAR